MASLAYPQKPARSPRKATASPSVPHDTSVRLTHPVMLAIFMLTMTQPYLFVLGPLIIGPYRVVLLIFSLPLIFNWLRGKYDGFILADWLVLGHVMWIVLSLITNGESPGSTLEYAGAQFLDIHIAYLLGRAAIRNKADFYFFAKFFLGILLFLLPFAFLESTQGKMILQDTFRNLPSVRSFSPITLRYPERLGLRRAMTAFVHPILFGVTAAMAVSIGLTGLRYCKGGMSFVTRAIWTMGALGGTFLSLSAGALLPMMVQLGLFGWDRALKNIPSRWKILGGGLAIVYVVLEIIAARPPLVVMSRLVAFSSSTAWNRYLIWQFGSAEVWRHPILGMGLFTEWQRAPWMTASIDNHWLLIAMRYGLPGIGMLLGAYFYTTVRLIRRNFSHDPELDWIRKGFVFTFIAMFLSFVTVASWHVTYCILMLMLGGSVWLFNGTAATPVAARESKPAPRRGGGKRQAEEPAPAEPVAEAPAPRRRYTRFPTDQ